MVLSYYRNFQEGLVGKYSKAAGRLLPKISMLEIAYNTGYFSRALMDRDHKVLRIEKDEEAAKIVRDRGVPVICGDIENPSVFSPIKEKFDVVLLMDVLEHLRNPVDVLKKLRSVLKQHGRAVIRGPNVAYWSVRKDLLYGRWNYTDAGVLDRTHLHFYTAPTWQALIDEAGCKIAIFEPAEGMIPLEHILSKIPIIGLITPLLRNAVLNLLPELFTTVYLIEAVATETLQKHSYEIKHSPFHTTCRTNI